MSAAPVVTRISEGEYLVEADGQQHLVYVAGPRGARWAAWNGRVFQTANSDARETRPRRSAAAGQHALCAPMPATVLKVLVAAGDRILRGDTLVVLEAMKMEMPVKAEADGQVSGVLCREGELVQAGAQLVELA